MAPQKNNNAVSGGEDIAVNLSTGDVKLLDAVLKGCAHTSKPNPTNWEAISKQLDLKDSKSARERFRQVCKKHHWFEATAEEPVTPTPSPKKRAAREMIPTPTPEDMVNPTSGEEGDVKATPSKKRKTTPVKKRQASGAKKTAKVKAEAETDSFEADAVRGAEGVPNVMFDLDEA
ncbi:hypothetical protein F5Y05DRAFT_290512 [Hypoxylon sp. FL0543]|nr:hypothetical protein F5Y05DRAFT_290512 [Hypoxylon sp. FL0543]